MSPTNFTAGMSIPDKINSLSRGDAQLAQICLQLGEQLPEAELHRVYNMLDQLDLRGEVLSMLVTGTCQNSAYNLGMLIFAYRSQLAGVDMRSLLHAAHNQGQGIDMAEVLRQIAELGNEQ